MAIETTTLGATGSALSTKNVVKVSGGQIIEG